MPPVSTARKQPGYHDDRYTDRQPAPTIYRIRRNGDRWNPPALRRQKQIRHMAEHDTSYIAKLTTRADDTYAQI